MNIKELLAGSENANVSVTVSVADLREFAMLLIDEAKELGKAEKEPERWLTPKEAAELMGVSENTLWRWNASGYLKHAKLGRRPFYRLSDINALRERRA